MTTPVPEPERVPVPVPVPPFVPAAVLRSPVALGRAAAVLLGLVVATDLFACFADVLELRITSDIADGGRGPGVLVRAQHADAVTAIARFTHAWTMLAAAVVYVCWLWRVRVNAEVFDPARHGRARGWTIGGWVCPLVNLWFPRQIVLDTWDASVPWGERAGHRTVNTWWGVWIVSILTWWLASMSRGNAGTARLMRNAVAQTLFSDVTNVLAACLAIAVVVRLTRMQHRKALAGPAPAAPVVG